MSKAKKAGSAHWGSLRHPSIFWVGHKDDDAVTEMKATGGKWNFFFGWALQYISHPSSPQYLLYFAWFYREIERRSLANCIGKKNGLCSHRQLNIGHSYGFGSQAKPRTHTHMYYVILLPDPGSSSCSCTITKGHRPLMIYHSTVCACACPGTIVVEQQQLITKRTKSMKRKEGGKLKSSSTTVPKSSSAAATVTVVTLY